MDTPCRLISSFFFFFFLSSFLSFLWQEADMFTSSTASAVTPLKSPSPQAPRHRHGNCQLERQKSEIASFWETNKTLFLNLGRWVRNEEAAEWRRTYSLVSSLQFSKNWQKKPNSSLGRARVGTGTCWGDFRQTTITTVSKGALRLQWYRCEKVTYRQ